MKNLLLLIIISFLAISSSTWAQSDTLPNSIGKNVSTPEGLKKIIDNKDTRFVIIDVRRESSYNMGYIPTAINIPFGFISDVKNPPTKDKYIIIYCNHGLITKSAGERILADGYQYVLDWGSITKWPYELETSK